MLRLTLLLLLFKNNLALEARLDGKLYRFEKFGEPCQNETSMVNWTINNFRNVGKNLMFDFKIFVQEIIERANLEISIVTCGSKEALDTCRLARILKSNKACFLISAKHQIWSPVFKCIQPKPACPLQKMTYFGRNCSLDFSVFNYVPLGRIYWKMKGKITKPSGEVLGCAVLEGQRIKD